MPSQRGRGLAGLLAVASAAAPRRPRNGLRGRVGGDHRTVLDTPHGAERSQHVGEHRLAPAPRAGRRRAASTRRCLAAPRLLTGRIAIVRIPCGSPVARAAPSERPACRALRRRGAGQLQSRAPQPVGAPRGVVHQRVLDREPAVPSPARRPRSRRSARRHGPATRRRSGWRCPACSQKASVGPFSTAPATNGLTATTGATARSSASRIPRSARIGPIETTGLDGPITITSARPSASRTSGVGARGLDPGAAPLLRSAPRRPRRS